MHGSNRSKQAHSRPQRRWRFQPAHLTDPQRRRRFHGQPANATGGTTTKPHTGRHETHNTNARRPTLTFETQDTNARWPTLTFETHDTNARRPTLTFETHNTNARLKPPKTERSTPAKATPVSRASRHHCHLELQTAQSHLSLTGSGRHPCKGGTLTTKSMFHACFTRISLIAPYPYRDESGIYNSTRERLLPPSHATGNTSKPQRSRWGRTQGRMGAWQMNASQRNSSRERSSSGWAVSGPPSR